MKNGKLLSIQFASPGISRGAEGQGGKFEGSTYSFLLPCSPSPLLPSATNTMQFKCSLAYSLTDQIRRSSRSVCANLAEAWRKRRYEGAFIAKLSDSESEAAETQTWIEFAVKYNYLEVEAGRELYQTYNQVLGKLVSMINNPSPWLMSTAREGK